MNTATKLLPLAAAMLLAGCATQGPVSVPTSIKAGQSWVVDRESIASQVLDTCSRDSPGRHPGLVTGYWAPVRSDIEQLESHQDQLQPTITDPAGFDRQYVGITLSDGRRLIYVNAFRLPDSADLDPAKTAVRACDGGASFWGALYDPTSGRFSDVAVNGQL